MAAINVSSFTSLAQSCSATRSLSSSKASSCLSHPLASGFVGASLPITSPKKKVVKNSLKVSATAAVETASVKEEIKEFTLPSWAMFELGRAPVYWKTMNGLPPTAGEKLKLFYNPAANKLALNQEYGVAFNGGFNQPIMCGGEPRAMRRTDRGTADGPIFTIQIVIPKHALNVIFSFTNGVDWDGPYRLRFQVPKAWQNRSFEFFNEGLAEELSKEGACERAIFPDTNVVVPSCAMVGNLSVEGGDRCDLDLVPGCMDPSSHLFNPLANVDDGSCPIDAPDSVE